MEDDEVLHATFSIKPSIVVELEKSVTSREKNEGGHGGQMEMLIPPLFGPRPGSTPIVAFTSEYA